MYFFLNLGSQSLEWSSAMHNFSILCQLLIWAVHTVDVLTIRVCVFFVLNSPVHLNECDTFIIYREVIEAGDALHQCTRLWFLILSTPWSFTRSSSCERVSLAFLKVESGEIKDLCCFLMIFMTHVQLQTVIIPYKSSNVTLPKLYIRTQNDYISVHAVSSNMCV